MGWRGVCLGPIVRRGGGGGVIQINFPKSPCSSNFYNMLEMLT